MYIEDLRSNRILDININISKVAVADKLNNNDFEDKKRLPYRWCMG